MDVLIPGRVMSEVVLGAMSALMLGFLFLAYATVTKNR